MRRRSLIVLALGTAFAAVLGGCATTKAVDPVANRLERIGVVVLVGEVLTQTNTGITVFGNESYRLDVSSWELRRKYADAVVQAMRKVPGTTARALEVDAGPFASIVDTRRSPYEDPQERWTALEPRFRAVAAENKVDALLLVVPARVQDRYSTTWLSDLGIYTVSRGEIRYFPHLHLYADMVVVSGKTGGRLGSSPLFDGNVPTTPKALRPGYPAVELSDSVARTPLAQMTPQQLQIVRDAASTFVNAVADASVPQLFAVR